ncbi:MAG: hypothetical protein CM15mP78_00900 [Candidatus Poseidoniales archaeon]|nr:MAG: hypothetical protein CM15mP78_00900 [Candidatus Poseidoniales archaeon]
MRPMWFAAAGHDQPQAALASTSTFTADTMNGLLSKLEQIAITRNPSISTSIR